MEMLTLFVASIVLLVSSFHDFVLNGLFVLFVVAELSIDNLIPDKIRLCSQIRNEAVSIVLTYL